MKQTAEAYLGHEIKDAVITVPAYFNDAQRQATKDADVIAGLNVARIITELAAAAIVYGLNKKDNILTISNSVVLVLATSGDTHLGGVDINQRIMEYFIKLIMKKHGKDIRKDKRPLAKLRREAEPGKRELCNPQQVYVKIESLFDGMDFSESLTRSQFEVLNIYLFRKTISHVYKVLEDSRLTKFELDDIAWNPDEAVAFVAAVQGGIMSGEGGDYTIVKRSVLFFTFLKELAHAKSDAILSILLLLFPDGASTRLKWCPILIQPQTGSYQLVLSLRVLIERAFNLGFKKKLLLIRVLFTYTVNRSYYSRGTVYWYYSHKKMFFELLFAGVLFMASGGSDHDVKYALSRLLQRGTTAEYQNEFEMLIIRVMRKSEFFLTMALQIELLRAKPTTLGEAFSLSSLIEAHFEAISEKEKEQTIKKKVVTILSLQNELASPEVKRSLDANEDMVLMRVVGGIEMFRKERAEEEKEYLVAAVEAGLRSFRDALVFPPHLQPGPDSLLIKEYGIYGIKMFSRTTPLRAKVGFEGVLNDMDRKVMAPLTLRIETDGGVMTKLIPRNTVIPTKRSQVFRIYQGYQTVFSIMAYEGESSHPKDCRILGTFYLSRIPLSPSFALIEFPTGIIDPIVLLIHMLFGR
ncbi:luminal binding protein 5 [Tanacetum coccineum]